MVNKTKVGTSAIAVPLKKQATVYEVAKLAAVSTATVARVFSDHPYVSDDARVKVLKAANMLNYKVNPLARGLAGGQTHSLGLIWEYGIPVLPQNVFSELGAAARSQSYQFQLIGSMGSRKEIKDLLQAHLIRGFDGMALSCSDEGVFDEEIESILSQFKASVLIAGEHITSKCDQIIWGRANAVKEAVLHFKKTGRRKPCMIASIKANRHKHEAFLKYLSETGYVIDKSTTIDCMDYAGAGKFVPFLPFFKDLLDSGQFNSDAIICSNDKMAAIVKELLIAKGIRVPQDVAIVGFDNDEFADILRIASVDRNHEELGQQISKLLFARLEDPKLEPQLSTVNMRFVLRESAFGAKE